MHYGDNIDKSILDRVENCIWEYVDKNSSDLPIEQSPSLWRISRMSYGRVDGINETDLQSLLALSVEIGCGLKLEKSLPVELIFHSAYFCRSLATASSPGIPIALPDRSSCNRRFASVAQRPWIPIFCCVQTLNKAVSKQCSRFTRKRKSLICNIFYAHVHNERISGMQKSGAVLITTWPITGITGGL